MELKNTQSQTSVVGIMYFFGFPKVRSLHVFSSSMDVIALCMSEFEARYMTQFTTNNFLS